MSIHLKGATSMTRGLIAASVWLAGCGGVAATPTTPVRIVVPATRTPAATATEPPVERATVTPTLVPIATLAPTTVSTSTVVQAPTVTAASTARPRSTPTATPPPAACATVTFDDLRKKGPRPPALDEVADGGCVQVVFSTGPTRYIWHPAGARFAPGSSMYVRWKDGLVAVFRKDGVLKTNEYFKGKQTELALLLEAGKYKLPASGSFVFAANDDGTLTGLVDTLIRAGSR